MAETTDHVIPDLPGNSYDSKSRLLKPLVTGTVKRRIPKKTVMQKIMGDDNDGIGHYILVDIVLPALKNILADVVTNGIEMILYGNEGSGRTARSRKRSGQTDYGSFYRTGRDKSRRREASSFKSTGRYQFDDILIETREEGNDVLSAMEDILEEFEAVTVADFYELVGIRPEPSDNNYGWTSLARAKMIRTSDGHVFSLPRPVELED
jgi:hypothetical protein